MARCQVSATGGRCRDGDHRRGLGLRGSQWRWPGDRELGFGHAEFKVSWLHAGGGVGGFLVFFPTALSLAP